MQITAISDLHGQLPDIPKCDLLVIAGDICPHSPENVGVGTPEDMAYQAEWLDTVFRDWLDAVPAKEVAACWGNHDFIAERRPDLVPKLRWSLLHDSGVDLAGLRLWGSPFSLWYYDWAFNAPKAAGEDFLRRKFKAIPASTDILVVHGPPRGFGDLTMGGEHVGSAALAELLYTRGPRLTVSGHIHEGYGKWEFVGDNRWPHLFANASVLDHKYRLVNAPITVEL